MFISAVLLTLAGIWILRKLGIIEISTTNRWKAWASNYLLDNLVPFMLTLAVTAILALTFATIFFIRGGLPRISQADINFLFPGQTFLNCSLSRWWDLPCLAVWAFANLNIPRIFYKFSYGVYQKNKWRAAWRGFKIYWRWILTLLAGVAAIFIFHAFIYVLAANVIAWLALLLIHPRTLRIYLLIIVKIIEFIGTLWLMAWHGDADYRGHQEKNRSH
jgi:hypothetical protein